jgi:hypothetical protein
VSTGESAAADANAGVITRVGAILAARVPHYEKAHMIEDAYVYSCTRTRTYIGLVQRVYVYSTKVSCIVTFVPSKVRKYNYNYNYSKVRRYLFSYKSKLYFRTKVLPYVVRKYSKVPSKVRV